MSKIFVIISGISFGIFIYYSQKTHELYGWEYESIRDAFLYIAIASMLIAIVSKILKKNNIVKNKIEKVCKTKQEEEIDHFVKILSGFDKIEKIGVARMAEEVRLEYLRTEFIDMMKPYDALELENDICIKLNRLIQDLQRMGKAAAAPGVMVWLHTLRCVKTPENRAKAKEMWKILKEAYDPLEIPEGFDWKA